MSVSKYLYIPKHLELIECPNKGLGVIATKSIREGEVVCELYFDSIGPSLTAHNAIQMGEDVFLNNNLKTIDDYFNHNCAPNTRINFSRYSFEALRDIEKGEEITWNYLTTEYDMVRYGEDFDCKCGSENCMGRIKGFKFLTRTQKQRLWPYLSPYLMTKL